MITFKEDCGSVIVTLGYGTCGIGVGVLTGEPCLIIDQNEEGGEIGKALGLGGPAIAFGSVLICFPTEAQRDAVKDAIFRFKQDADGNWYDSGVAV